ncbi:MAG: RagB/SusD family nutrient uptake outer membrane protein, partial [Bacteroidales bacterium]
MKRIVLIALATIIVTAACDYLEPRPIQHLSTDELLSTADYGEGLLTTAYGNLNPSYDINSEYYTDNAVPSRTGSNTLALGGWTLEGNPIGNWNLWYSSINYCNHYLELGEDLLYSVSDPVMNEALQKNRRAEAFYLRAWYHWKLLQTYGGPVDGASEIMGVPIVTNILTIDDNLDLARDTYEDVVAQIVEDLDSAMAVLPLRYNGSLVTDNISNRGRASGLGAMALKARVYLYAASPAYGPSTTDLWERAALAAFDAIEASGGLTDLVAHGNFNNFTSFDNIWIQPPFTSNAWENSFYPPSIYGNGDNNPSQNLVDAFPAKDGYPIDLSASFDPNYPYNNRDPRFEKFIFYTTDYYNGTYIRTYEGGPDAPGGLTDRGTRTSYYMKKLLSRNVQLTPGDVTSDDKFFAYLTRAELYLNFAEAANEAFGSLDASFGYSAAEVLGKVRQRAGIDSAPSTDGYQDQYLDDQAAAGEDEFRTLIHNERRIELSFEGYRFWDIRRLDQPLNHTITGVTLEPAAVVTLPDWVENIALKATASDDHSPYASETALNNGSVFSGGRWHNWNSANIWRYVQYEFGDYMTYSDADNVYQVNQSDVYWWTDGGGVMYPDSVYIVVWDLDTQDWV